MMAPGDRWAFCHILVLFMAQQVPQACCCQGRCKARPSAASHPSGHWGSLDRPVKELKGMTALQEPIYADPSDPTKFFQQEDSTVKVRERCSL